MEDEIYLKEEEAKKSKHRFSTVALVFMMFLFIGGAVIAALTGGGSPGYLVKWNTSTSIEDSIVNETSDLITVFGDQRLQKSTTETILYIHNTGVDGDPQIQFQLGTGVSPDTKVSMGLDDTGDLFEINYGEGLTGDPEFSISLSTVQVGDAKLGYNYEFQTGCDTTPSVVTTNVIKLYRLACSITNFDIGLSSGQLLFVMCGRPPAVGNLEVVDSGVFGDMRLANDADFVCGSDGDILTLLSVNGIWWEVSRAFQ